MTTKQTKKDTPKEPKEKSTEEKLADYTDHLQRLQAEFDNYRKQIEKEKQQIKEYANYELIQKMLTILDTFEIALKHNNCDDEFAKGMKMIYSEIFNMLEKEGLKKIQAEGKFDHNIHEVLLTEESDTEENTILEELQKGYMLKEKILRYTKVKIAKPKQGGKND